MALSLFLAASPAFAATPLETAVKQLRDAQAQFNQAQTASQKLQAELRLNQAMMAYYDAYAQTYGAPPSNPLNEKGTINPPEPPYTTQAPPAAEQDWVGIPAPSAGTVEAGEPGSVQYSPPPGAAPKWIAPRPPVARAPPAPGQPAARRGDPEQPSAAAAAPSGPDPVRRPYAPPVSEGGALPYIRSLEKKMQFGDFAGALEDADQAVLADPGNPAARLLRAQVLSRLERFEEAEESALESARLDPGSSTALEVLAWAQLNQGKFREAQGSATRALALDPYNAFAYAIRAYAQEQLGNKDETLRDMAAAARLNPAAFGAQLQNARAGKRLYSGPRGGKRGGKGRMFRGRRAVLTFLPILGLIIPALAGLAYLAAGRRRKRPQ